MSTKRKIHIVKGEETTMEEACEKYNLKPATVRNRMYSKEITLEAAIFFVRSKHPVANKGSKEWQNLKLSPRINIKDL